MALLRLLLMLLAGYFVARLVRRALRPRRPRGPRVRRQGPREPDGQRLRNLTQQDISDADYEEIP